MTDIPAKIAARRAELLRQADEHHNSMLALTREARVTDARLAEIDFAIAAYADCAVSAEAGAQVSAAPATPGTPGAESAPAGTAAVSAADMQREVSRSWVQDRLASAAERKKPSAPKRDIRGMVIEYVETKETRATLGDIGLALNILPRQVNSAVAYWQAKGRLTFDGGVVGLRTERLAPDVVPIEVMHTAFAEASVVTHADDPVEMHPEMALQALIGFLTRTPDCTMDELREAGIEPATVYLAEKDGVVIAKAHGLYDLVESEQRAAE